MRYINSIKEVSHGLVKLKNNLSLLGINNEFFVKDSSDSIIKFPFQILESQSKKISGKYLFYQEGEYCYKVDCETMNHNIFYKTKHGFDIWICNEDFIFLAKRTEIRREYEFSLLDLKSGKTKWSDKSMIRYFSKTDNQLLFTDFFGEIYKKRRFEDGSTVWTLDFSENRINGNVLLIDNVLVFPTTNQDLIGIEIETGKELWRLPNCNLHHQQQPNTNYLVGLASNSFGDNFYQVIDSVSGKKIVYKKFDNFFYETQPTLACITAIHYYFISNVVGDGTGIKSERQTHLGCINLQTHEIEWIEKVGTTANRVSSYQKPEINGNKIYLLDGEKTLYIYELDK